MSDTPNNGRKLSLKRGTDNTADSRRLEERLHKVLAQAGLGSRRALEQRIADGLVKVNGELAQTGMSIRGGDRVELDGKVFVASALTDPSRVLVYNKPEGEVTTREDPEGRPTIFESLPALKGARWIAVGRLDINTTGLLLLTTDGELANAMMHPSFEVEREYVCRVRAPEGEETVSEKIVDRLRRGVALEDGPAKFDEIKRIGGTDSNEWFQVTVKEGRNREVRRLWESQGCQVSRLKRIRYGSIELPRQLRRGNSEALDADTIRDLRRKAGLSEPQPALTLSPVLRQRRANRSLTEFKPERNESQRAWTGAYQNEARELTAFDRIRDDGPPRGGKHKRRPRGDVNGNVAQPDKSRPRKHKKKRSVAPGQELPSVRTWFAGDNRNKGGRGKPGGGKPGGNRSGKSGGPRRGGGGSNRGGRS